MHKILILFNKTIAIFNNKTYNKTYNKMSVLIDNKAIIPSAFLDCIMPQYQSWNGKSNLQVTNYSINVVMLVDGYVQTAGYGIRVNSGSILIISNSTNSPAFINTFIDSSMVSHPITCNKLSFSVWLYPKASGLQSSDPSLVLDVITSLQ